MSEGSGHNNELSWTYLITVQHEGLGGAFFFDVAVSRSDSCMETVTSAHMLYCEHRKHHSTMG